MSSFKSSENHRSVTTLTSRSLPKDPAGMICVTRDPLTLTPFSICGASSSLDADILPSVCSVEEDCSLECELDVVRAGDEPAMLVLGVPATEIVRVCARSLCALRR